MDRAQALHRQERVLEDRVSTGVSVVIQKPGLGTQPVRRGADSGRDGRGVLQEVGEDEEGGPPEAEEEVRQGSVGVIMD